MTSNAPHARVFGILPAAGMSRRMGTPKQTLRYRETTLTGHVARTMLAVDLDAIVVVTRTELVDALDLPRDDRVLLAINADASSQMFDSILIGLDCLEDSTDLPTTAGILVIPADMPTVSAQACDRCIDGFRRNPSSIVIATCHGKRGHPIVFPSAIREALRGLTGGLKELPRSRPDLVLKVAMDDPGILCDVDTPADYDALER